MAAREIGKITPIGTASYVVNSTTATATQITYVLQNVSSTATVTKVATVTPEPCGLLDTADGLIIAWGIAAAWLITYAVLMLRRGVHE